MLRHNRTLHVGFQNLAAYLDRSVQNWAKLQPQVLPGGRIRGATNQRMYISEFFFKHLSGPDG